MNVLAAMPTPLAFARLSACIATLLLGACSQNPVLTPVGWWHDLSGGAIASDRPPPPGADDPYPKIYTIPPRPVLPSDSYRKTIETQLAQERDNTERLAARNPIVVEPPSPPPPPAQAPPPTAADLATGNAPGASATVPAADAPPPKPQAAPAPPVQVAADGGPPAGAPLTIVGAAPDASNLPDVPDAPPPPATFEGIPAEPAPTRPPPLPPPPAPAAQGAQVFFPTGGAVLDSSQGETIKGAAAKRGKGSIEVEGHGDAQSDTPDGQAAALQLALKRAEAVAKALEAQRVPASAIRISATAFGRGASLRVSS